MISIVLDVAHDDQPLEEVLDYIIQQVPSVTTKLLELDGPAGWPVVDFTLDEDDLLEFAKVYGADLDDLVGWSTPA